MRMNKFVGVGLLVVVLAMGSVVVGLADPPVESDVVSAVATFTIPDYISISAASDTVDLDGGGVTVPNTYSATNALTVLSTKAWSVSHSFVWTSYGDGFNTSGDGANLFSVTGTGDGEWGLDTFNATYSLNLTGNNMQYFPEGSYVVTVTHTATTNSGS